MISRWLWFMFASFTGAIAAMLLGALIALIVARPMIQLVLGSFIKRLMKDRYPENIWEMVTAISRTGPTAVIENSLRAASGKAIERPFGSIRKFLNFDGLMFSPAQLATQPADTTEKVDLRLVIGPKAKKPLTLDIPLMAGAMGYGIGINEKTRVAIARGTAAVGTATNTGEGGFLPEDRTAAKYLILQYNSASWNKEEEILRQADAIEIHIGQGASAGTPSVIPAKFLQGRAAEVMNVQGVDPVIIPAKHNTINSPKDLKQLIDKLRRITDGVPIGVKICPSAYLEDDLDVAIQAKVDFISLDGAQAGTKGSLPTVEDDFGLPTIYALPKAVQYLQKKRVKDRITLLSGGGYTNPGQILKAIALGADGIYMGTSLLWAMTHEQVTKAIPWEPPTQLAFYPGNKKHLFDEDKAAEALEKFFHSYIEEMQTALRAMGKTSIRDLSKSDLIALDEWTSKVTKVPLAYDSE